MKRPSMCVIMTTAALAAAAMTLAPQVRAESPIARGKYLVGLAGCNDCHTPGYFFGKPDMTKYLGGSDVGFEIPGLGVFPGRNITPDKETGIGNWTDEQIISALTAGRRPDGRQLVPIMPYHAFSSLTKDDVTAIVAYLRSIPPVKYQMSAPLEPGKKVSIFTFRILPPGEIAAQAPK